MSFGDVDRDCDGTLLLSEQGEPISIRRTLELPPEDLTEEERAELGDDAFEDRFEPTDFVRGTVVDFDTTSEQGGSIRDGSLVYTPPDGFTGEDRYTFLVDTGDYVREAEVLVTVRHAEALASPSPSPSPRPSPTVDQDAAESALRASPVAEREPRWDPPWLALLATLAAALVSLGVAWWLLLVVRVRDRDDDEEPTAAGGG